MSGILMVKDVMVQDVKTVKISSNILEAVKKMNKFNIGSVIVVDGGRPVGLITERDILRRIVEQGFDPSLIRVNEIMSHPLLTIDPGVSIEEAARLMTRKQIKKLPVVKDDQLVGIITSMDIVKTAPRLIEILDDILRTTRRYSTR